MKRGNENKDGLWSSIHAGVFYIDVPDGFIQKLIELTIVFACYFAHGAERWRAQQWAQIVVISRKTIFFCSLKGSIPKGLYTVWLKP